MKAGQTKNLPFLPGNVYSDPTVTRYHKTQLLNLKDGTVQGKSFLIFQNRQSFWKKMLMIISQKK